jgi:hypothetical protein
MASRSSRKSPGNKDLVLKNLFEVFLFSGLLSIRMESSPAWVLRIGGAKRRYRRVRANLTKGPIYKASMEDTRSGATLPGRKPMIPMIHVNFPSFSAKSDHP